MLSGESTEDRELPTRSTDSLRLEVASKLLLGVHETPILQKAAVKFAVAKLALTDRVILTFTPCFPDKGGHLEDPLDILRGPRRLELSHKDTRGCMRPLSREKQSIVKKCQNRPKITLPF